MAVTKEIHEKLVKIDDELRQVHLERPEIVPGLMTAIIAHQHLLMVAKGGTGKSFITRDIASRITGTNYYEIALDETTTPDQILGAPDIKSMVEEGKVRRVTDGMLPTAHFAFLDEFFNSNGPALHSMMPLLNERIFHNNGKPMPVPLRTAVCATNKLNSDADQAALWDRIHHRHELDYVRDRDNVRQIVTHSVLRKMTSYVKPEYTTITLEELDQAHDEAMALDVSEIAWETFLDLIEELGRNGVEVSTRRQAEGMAGVLATAWLNGHSEVLVGDLTVLRHMFWTLRDQIPVVKNIVLTATNPGEKKALELLDDLDKLKAEYQTVAELDDIKRNAAAVDIFKKTQRLQEEGEALREKAQAAGAGTQRISDLIESCQALWARIGQECFGATREQIAALPRTRR